MKASDFKGKIDFALITIRDDEHRAVLARFPSQGIIEGTWDCSLSKINIIESNEYYNVAVARCAEKGTGDAQYVANCLITDLDPNWILLVGIAGGVPSDDFTLGDVVIASRLVDFCVEAVTPNGSQYDTYGGPMHPVIQNYIVNLAAKEKEFKGWNSVKSIGRKKPPVDLNDNPFYGDTNWKEKVREKLQKEFSGSRIRPPKFITATNISSDRLVKDPSILQKWHETARGIQSIEMELAGIYRAARKKDKEFPILAIRGISDIVGFKRHDDWTQYACHSAAALAKALITKTKPITPKIQSSKSQISTNSNKKKQEDQETKLNLLTRLSKLPNPVFNNLLTILTPTNGLISQGVPQATQSSELITWAESELGCGLPDIEEVLGKLTNP
ncbi:MAG: hypothetical protein WAQ98_15745 [Blastocatellia bacterium]